MPSERRPRPAGAPRPGHATRDDVCRATGVSTATVSRALNNQPGVSAAVREKVLAAARELNYAPHAAARSLSAARTNTVGIVFQDLTWSWFLTVFKGVMARCSGYDVLHSISTRAGDEFDLPRRMLAERRVDGIVWLDQRVTPRMVSAIRDLGRPFVALQMHTTDPRINSVMIESRAAASEAVRHLLQLGHRRIVLVTGPHHTFDSAERLAGARAAFREARVELRPGDILEAHHMPDYAIKLLKERLESGPRPDAIFSFNDQMAIAMLLWLREHGIRVPEDIALVGFDGLPEGRYVGLTTVETPMYDMGVLGAQILLETMTDPSGERQARQVELKGHLLIRDTCGWRLKHGHEPLPHA